MDANVAALRKSLQLTRDEFHRVICECGRERAVYPELKLPVGTLRSQFWERTGCGEFTEHCGGVLLGLGHIRFIKWVDAQNDACDRCCRLPVKELSTKVYCVTQRVADDGVSCGRKFVESSISGSSICSAWCAAAVQRDAHEEAIVLVALECAEWFEVNGDDAYALLSCALCNELLRPCAEAVDRLINEEGQLIAPLARERTNDHAERNGTVGGWLWLAQLSGSDGACSEQRIQVNAEKACWHEPNKAECGVASANVSGVQEAFEHPLVPWNPINAW